MTAAGFDLAEELSLTELARAPLLRRTLQSLGLRPGEVFTVFGKNGTDRHYELSGN
jgi:hypothetical protein